MTSPELLEGLHRLQFGLHIKFSSASEFLYIEQLEGWSGEDWTDAVQAFLDSDDPPKRFPTTGQCKKALRDAAAARRRRSYHQPDIQGCPACHKGWVVGPDPAGDAFYGYSAGTMKAAALCRCASGMHLRSLKGLDMVRQVSLVEYQT